MSDDVVTEALKKARYNETVHLTIDQGDGNGPPTQICLIPCLNEQQGGIQFNNLVELARSSNNAADQTKTDQEIVLSRELRTNRWFFPMLNDHRRNYLYQKSIEAASQALVNRLDTLKSNRESDAPSPIRVLDIGSGTGLLSMMAARSFQNLSVPVQITSLEMSSAFCFLATRTVLDNSLSELITVQEGHSTAVILDGKVDMCISELLEDGLLGEGWLPAIRDAWTRHLKPDAIVLPRGARVYAALVQAEWLPNYAGPYEYQFHKSDVALEPHHVSFHVDSEASECLIDTKHVVLPVHAEKLLRDGSMLLLSNPIELFSFDVSCSEQIPGPEGRQRTVSVTATADAEAHGALVWWELDIWDGNTYSTEPGKEPWQDHWHPCLHLFSRIKGVRAGESVDILAKHNDSRIFVDLVVSIDQDTPVLNSIKRRKADDELATAVVSQERAFQLNSADYLDTYYQAIESALSMHRSWSDDDGNNRDNALVLDVSDFSLGACIAAVLGARRVISLESSSGDLPITAARVAQLGNRIVPVPGIFDFEILQCYTEQLTLGLLGSAPVDILCSEPYYEILEGWHLQEAMAFHHTVRLLRSNRLLSERAIVIPSSFRILGCIIQSDQLRSAYCACGDKNRDANEHIWGLDHSFVNRTGSCFDEFDLSMPMWQYDYTVLSEVIELAALAYSDPNALPSIRETVAGAFRTAGRCDALLVWLEYVYPANHPLNSSNLKANVLSTNNQSHRQIVRMLNDSSPYNVAVNEKTEFTCTSWLGSCVGSDDHQFNVRINVGS